VPATPTIQHLRELSQAERREFLTELVVAEFRDTLLMTEEDEELSTDTSFFDLGLTSLRLTEVKERLETLLACGIDTNTLFNSPTIEALVGHLVDHGLTEYFTDTVSTADGHDDEADDRDTVADLLDDLYQV
jgi:acyl carrier protein